MNNEPVAWMDEDENVVFEKCKAFPIPLYTHPVEELTDEEIIEELKPLPQLISMEDKDFIDFARAILRKAQEK